MKPLLARMTLPGRWLAPLMLLLFALTASVVSHVVQLRNLDMQVMDQETRRLRERISVEQSRLDSSSALENPTLVRRLVGGLGLYSGMRHIYLLQRDGWVEASLVRSDIGQAFGEVLRLRADLTEVDKVVFGDLSSVGIRVLHLPSTQQLVGVAPITNGRRLVTVVDLSLPRAVRLADLREDALREGVLLLGVAALLALVMHLVWFRRARHLTSTLQRMGNGELQARVALQGKDELAMIGTEADRMAERLQAGQVQLRHLVDLVDRSPVVVVEWHNEPGWPVSYEIGRAHV